MIKRRVIFDTNVLISRLLLPDSTSARAVRRLLDRAQPIVSENTLSELANTLTRPKFDPYVSREDRQKFFELAVDGKADWIVTGDKDLLELSPFQGTSIINPPAVLALPESAFL